MSFGFQVVVRPHGTHTVLYDSDLRSGLGTRGRTRLRKRETRSTSVTVRNSYLHNQYQVSSLYTV